MAPPLVMAASRAPRRARSRPCTRSQWRCAERRPRRVATPSASSSSTALEVGPRADRDTDGRGARARTAPPTPISRARGDRDALLREDVARAGGHRERVELAGAHRAHGGRRLHQIVARERKDDALRHRAARVSGAADALDQRREGARRADVAHQVDRADVDAELERRRRHHERDLARLEPLLRLEPRAARHAAVVRGHPAGAEPLLERVRHALHQPARVDEHDGGAVRRR